MTARRTWRSRLRTVRARVTIVAGFGITAGVVLGLLLLYQLQKNSVGRTLDDQLRTYATQIEQAALPGTWPKPLPASALDANAQAQVTDATGHVLAATAGLSGRPAVYSLPPGSDTPHRLPAANGVIPGEVRTYGTRATVAGRPVTIITGTGTGVLSQVNEQSLHALLFGVPVILLLAGSTVWLVAGRALRPVEEIRHAVTDITSADLTRRVPEPGTDDEVGKLAVTMNDMLARLDEAAKRQRRFVADASHELRSPLAAIRTTLEVGLAHPDKAPWPTIAERAAGQTQRLEGLVQQLLLLAKADDRQLAARRRPVDVRGLLDEIRSTTPTVRARISLVAPADLATVGEPGNLERAFRNIVDNAVRYASTAVTITAATAKDITTDITTDTTTDTTVDSVRIDIDDDGPGIPTGERERVFHRFVRLDDSRDRGTGNSGLGLAIAREIVLAHHGSIVITDSPAGGARVTVLLPIAPDGASLIAEG